MLTSFNSDVTPAQEFSPPVKAIDSYSPAGEEPKSAKLMFCPPRFTSRLEARSGRIFRPRQPHFAVRFEVLEEGGIIAFNPQLPVEGFGDNHAEAFTEFCQAVAFQWANLVEVEEGSLTAGGLDLRKALVDA